jgi:predicted SAM-dependent methyltransferase
LNKIENNSAEVIYVSHVLEHIGRREYMTVLKRWYDILKPNGILRVAVPDFEKIVEHYNKNKELEPLRGFLHGGQNYPQNYHYCSWDFEFSLRSDIRNIYYSSNYLF